MNKMKFTLFKVCAVIMALYAAFCVVFISIAQYQMKYTSDEEVFIADESSTVLGELYDGTEVVQTYIPSLQYIRGVNILFLTYGRENIGQAIVSVVDPIDSEKLAEETIDLVDVEDNQWYELKFSEPVKTEAIQGEEVEIRINFIGGEQENAVTLGCKLVSDASLKLTVNGNVVEDSYLCVSVVENSDSVFAPYYLPILIAAGLILVIYCACLLLKEKKNKITGGVKFVHMLNRYSFLMKQLVSRDFKTKYKRSVLGVLWSFLNPLLTMAVQYAVFSKLFRFNIPNYPVYLLTGIVFFNGFSDATSQAMYAIVGNSSLITKVYVPKYIYPIAKVLSTSINLLFSLIPLMIVSLWTGVKITPALLMVPFGLICIIAFTIGVSFALSSAMVFFRDIQFLWGVFTMIWMYATPIIYSLSILEGTIMYKLQALNPMYHYITFFRTLIIAGTSPEPAEYLFCIGFAVVALLFGGLLFRKTQDKFVLYI